jgi:hypothetical protein
MPWCSASFGLHGVGLSGAGFAMLNQCFAPSKSVYYFLARLRSTGGGKEVIRREEQSLGPRSWPRRAGTYAASAATEARAIATHTNVSGSLAETPKSKWPSTREAASAPIPPRMSPAAIRISVSRETSRNIALREAPSAIRMAFSCVRHATE